jgi:uncharacterized membrane protein
MNQTEVETEPYTLMTRATCVVLAFQAAFLVAQLFNEGDSSTAMLGIMAATIVLLTVNRRIGANPQGQHAKGYIAAWRYGVLILLGVITAVAAWDAYIPVNMPNEGLPELIAMLLAAVVALKGAMLGKLKPGGVLGLRLPWTVESRLAWERAHRLMGRILFFGGLACLAAAPFIPFPAAFAGIGGVILAGIIAGAFEGWLAWRNDPERAA